jgi:hypothetical protein
VHLQKNVGLCNKIPTLKGISTVIFIGFNSNSDVGRSTFSEQSHVVPVLTVSDELFVTVMQLLFSVIS